MIQEGIVERVRMKFDEALSVSFKIVKVSGGESGVCKIEEEYEFCEKRH